jgi:hypothetical protein
VRYHHDKYWHHHCPTSGTNTGGGNGGGGNGGGGGIPGFAQVHILKYLANGTTSMLVPNATTTVQLFPVEATWTASNLNNGTTTTTSFSLGNFFGGSLSKFGANSFFMATGSSFSLHEVSSAMASSSNVVGIGGTCVLGSYRTVGYRSGDTLTQAEAAPLSFASPSFTNLTSDKYVLVVNEFCTANGMPSGGNTGGGGNNGGTGTTTATSTTNIVVVHYGDLAQNATDASSTNKWFFWNGGTGAIDSNATDANFVTGPGTPPLGVGSVELTSSDGQTHSIATNQFGGVKLRDLSALSFAAYVPNGTTTGTTTATTTPVTAPFLAFNVDLGGTGSGHGQLVFLPGQNGTVATDTWQTWNTLGTGRWAWSDFASSTSTTTPGMWPDLNLTQFRTWNDLVTAFPNSRISSSSPLFGVGIRNIASSTASTTARAFLDDLSITIASSTQMVGSTTGTASTTIFDFEPTPANTSSGGGGGGGGGGSSSGSSFIGGVGGGGAVLGASCPLITTWMRENQYNDANQVNLLQGFLNGEMNSNLTVSGVFGPDTTVAVNNFQVKYWQDVLLPWVPFGLPTDHTPTGYVYKTTSTKINRIACPNMTFPNPILP